MLLTNSGRDVIPNRVSCPAEKFELELNASSLPPPNALPLLPASFHLSNEQSVQRNLPLHLLLLMSCLRVAEPTLLEQLALLSNPTPADLDPELAYSSLSSSKNAQIKEDDGLGSDDDKGGRDHYLDVG